MKNVNPVCWFDIYVANLERAKRFYESVFNIKMTDLPPEWGKQSAFPFEDNGSDTTGALVEKEGYRPTENNTIVYFSSNDCLTEENKVESAGGKIIKPKSSIGEFGYISLFTDSEGNTVGLHSTK
jgi:predicted enzyme related to lactoylglutathione lyase